MKTKILFFSILLSAAFIFLHVSHSFAEPYTSFQTWRGWSPEIDLPTDGAMVYSEDPVTMRSWSERGYAVWSMFGASWLSKDEKIVRDHPEIVQAQAGGVPFEMIPGRAWVVPTEPWREYIKEKVGRLIANGTRAILPEEPEFFASNGYSEAFKDEWRKYYGEPWRAPHSSVTNLWMANRLKGILFTEFFRDVFHYAKSLNPSELCIIPAHSNLNYAHWGIISPHYAYSTIPDTDGFIAQVWTGTAKGTLPVGGKPISSVFDYSYLEYGYFENLAAGTQQQMWFLTDPVEDAPGATWDNLRDWYESTVTAALMHPAVNHYEVSPWPDRFLMGDNLYGGPGGSKIPEEYASELMTVWSAQRALPASGTLEGGSTEVAMLTADSLMWQRGGGRDRFAGHTAPMLSLIRNGVFVRVLPAEKFARKVFSPDGVRLIVASFDAWKPESPEIVEGIAEWIERGGTLLFMGGTDDFDAVESAWWREKGYETPADALVARLLPGERRKTALTSSKALDNPLFSGGTARRAIQPASGAPTGIAAFVNLNAALPLTAYGVPNAKIWMKAGEKPVVWQASCGKGTIVYAGFPGEYVANFEEGRKLFLELVLAAAKLTPGMDYRESGLIVTRRGPFVIAHSTEGTRKLYGHFANLFRPTAKSVDSIEIAEGGNAFLLDFDKAIGECKPASGACLLLAGGNVSSVSEKEKSVEFTISGPVNRSSAAWLYLPGVSGGAIRATSEMPGGSPAAIGGANFEWVGKTRVLHVVVPLSPDGVKVKINY
jgi:hypothetical protein